MSPIRASQLMDEEDKWQCWECSHLFEGDEVEEYNGKFYCKECLEEVKDMEEEN